MHANNNSVSRAETEEQLLRFLCASAAGVVQRREVFERLRRYSWRDNDHRILFEAIGDLLARNSQTILEHLPAELTRRGFPDISCDALSASCSLNMNDALALAEKLARASH
jgi:hypothetical protein